MSGNKAVFGTSKVALTCSSILGLALGMGAIAPAQAALIITNFSDFNPNASSTYASGGAVDFGPSYDTHGFTAQGSTDGDFNYFNLTGNNGNGVAVIPPIIPEFGPLISPPTSCSSPCTLKTFSPGNSVSSFDTFKSNGRFSVDASNGNYYFGLSDVNLPVETLATDPFGWVEITLNDGDVTLDRFAFEDTEITPAPIPAPEPMTLSLFAVGGAAVLAARRRKRAQRAA